MKILPLILCIALLTFSGAVHPQEEQEPGSGAHKESDAERVSRIEKVIASDTARLEELKEDLEERIARFDRTSASVKEREAKLEVMRAQLESTTDPDEAAEIEKEIEAEEEKYELVKKLSDLALQAAKAVRGQIQTLEQKIGIDQQALDELLGPAELPQIATPPAGVPAPRQPATQAPSQPTTIPGVPGMPGAPTQPGTSPSVVREILPETADQVEARKQAAKSKLEAEQAEQAVLSFLERKAALQKQIDLEQSLLGTALQSKEMGDQALQIRQRELDAIKAQGGSEAGIEEARAKLDRVIVALRGIDEEIDKREQILERFSIRMQALHDEQSAVTAQAEQKREQAEVALKESVWLNSAFHPKNIMRWGLDRGPDMLAVFLIVFVLLVLVRRFVQNIARAMVGKGRRSRRDATTRADTLALSFGSAATMVIAIIGLLLILEAAGINVATILGGAAILGVAIAFGAQNLMRDYFNGFIILIEDQYELNDLVTIGKITGRVESVSLRTTALRDLKGKLNFIPNGEIKSVTNRSYDWARIVFDIRVAYKENVDQVMAEVLSVAREVCAEPEYKNYILEEPQMLGVDAFTEFGVIIKLLLKTSPTELFPIKREILRRIKNRFDELGIEIPMADAAALPRT